MRLNPEKEIKKMVLGTIGGLFRATTDQGTKAIALPDGFKDRCIENATKRWDTFAAFHGESDQVLSDFLIAQSQYNTNHIAGAVVDAVIETITNYYTGGE